MKYDILILCKNDDLNKIKYLIKSIKINIIGYDDIYLITPDKVDMDGVVNITDYEVIEKKYKENIKHRPNWIFQQYIKLFQNVTKNDYYVVIDSDIYINKKIEIFTNNKPNFFIGRDQYHQQYFNFSKEFGISKLYEKSFISEIMVFDKTKIREFLSKIDITTDLFLEKSNNIIDQNCYISEFEFYGNMIFKYYNGSYNIKNINTMLNGKHNKWEDYEIENLINSNKNFDIISYHTWE
jgi:hypothetical protein